MGRSIANLLIKLGANSVEVDRMASKVRKNFQTMSKDLAAYGKKLSMYVTVPLLAATGVSVKNADVQLQAEAKLLKALNGRRDIQKRLIAQAGELQNKSTIGDETIIKQQAYFAALGLSEEQIRKATEASLEMEAVFGDVGINMETAGKSIGVMFGGLLGELGEKIPQLKQFTAEELKAGKGLEYLLKTYGGTAKYMAGQGLNPVKQMKNALGDLAEQFGIILIPYIQKASIFLKGLIGYVQNLPPALKSNMVAIAGVAAVAGPALLILPKLAAGFMALLSPIGLVTAALTAFGAVFAYAKIKEQTLVGKLVDDKSLEELESDLQKVRAKLDEMYKWRDKLANTPSHLVLNYGKHDLDRIDHLRKQEELLVKAIEQKEAAVKRAAKIESEANEAANKQLKELVQQQQKFQQELAKDESTAAAGSIKQLRQELNELQEAYDGAATSAERYRIAAQMERVQRLLDMAEADGTGVIARPEGMNGRLRQSLASVGPLQFDPSVLSGSRENWLNAERGLQANLQGFSERALEFIGQFNDMLMSGLQGLAISLAEGIGEAFGGEGIEELGDNIIRSVGNLIASLGALLITYATTMLAFKTAFNMVFANPLAALAVGAAMVIAGKAMSSAISKRAEEGVALADGGLAFGPTMALVGDNRGAGSDPEVIAPLSKLRQYGIGGGGTIQVGGKFVVSGSDLLLVLNREKSRQERMNG